jgi:group I intron endonuclease
MTMIPREPGCYILNHLETGKFYIGSSNNLLKRHQNHNSYLRNEKHHVAALQELFNEDDGIHMEFVATNTREEAYTLEQQELDRFINHPDCLNAANSATNVWKPGTKVTSPETIGKLREAALRRPSASVETRQKLSKANAGIPKTEEHKQKIAENARSRGARPEGAVVNRKVVTVDGITYPSISQAAQELPVSRCTLLTRLRSDDYPTWTVS